MPFLVFAWKPNENLKFYCIVLLSSSHSSIAILISSRTFPKALLIFKRASQKERTHKNCYLIPPTPPLPHLGVWTNYFLPSELKRIYVVIRSQIIMNSITAPKKHSPIIQLELIKSLSNQVMRITSVSEPMALAGSSKLQASTLIRWNEMKVNVYIHK